MNEIPEILNRALASPLTLTFRDADEARSWWHRANNYIRRHEPGLRQLMVSRRGAEIRIAVPQPHIQEENKC